MLGGCGRFNFDRLFCVDDSCLSTCDDREQNGDETDVDCGGGCAACAENADCGGDEDCISGSCDFGQCNASPPNVTINYRSIGQNTGTIHDVGAVSVLAKSRTLTFSAPLPDNVGVGDQLNFADQTVFVVTLRSPQQVAVDRLIASDYFDEPYEIRRAYQTPHEWEDDRQGDLVSESRREVGIVRNDSPFLFTAAIVGGNGQLDIRGSTTDNEHFMSLQVDSRDHHRGIAGVGAVFDGRHETQFGIQIYDDFTHIRGLTMRGFARETPAGDTAIWIAGQSVTIEETLIHDFVGVNARARGIRTTIDTISSPNTSVTIRNCILFGGDVGILLGTSGHQATIEHTTVYGMTFRGIELQDGTATIRNSVAMGNPIDIRVTGATVTQSHNMTSDGSAAGTGSLPSQNTADQFVSIATGSEDLHLRTNSDGIDSGMDLLTSVPTDIDGEMRPIGNGTDMGADEYSP